MFYRSIIISKYYFAYKTSACLLYHTRIEILSTPILNNSDKWASGYISHNIHRYHVRSKCCFFFKKKQKQKTDHLSKTLLFYNIDPFHDHFCCVKMTRK